MDTSRGAVGFIGLGIMGSLLVQRLLSAGHVVVVHNRTAAKAQPLIEAGAELAPTATNVAQRCRHVFIAVTGPEALTEVLFGPQGVLCGEALAVDHICDLSTQDPQVLRDAQPVLARRGITLSEAPMAGSVHDASRGTLQCLQGGDPERLRELSPYFACWGPSPIHFGPVGSATTAKLALNLLLALMASGLSDALTLLRRAGLDEQGFMAVLASSGLRSPLYERLWQRHVAGDYAPRFALGNLVKDIELCLAHPGWQTQPPGTLQALASRLRVVSAESLGSDYSVLLRDS